MKPGRLKTIVFAASAALAAAFTFPSLVRLIQHGRPSDYYTHIPLIPAVSAYLFIRRRKRYFQEAPASLIPGIIVLLAGLCLYLVAWSHRDDLYVHAAISMLAATVFLGGAYCSLFGLKALRRAFFPFAFLALAIPVPPGWMDEAVSVLASATEGVTHLLFKGLGVPFVHKGPIFYLPGFYLEVAQECSGIRSSIALLITTILAGHIFLDKSWKKIVLALAVFPVAVFKNGVRIITLYLLSYFVDIRIIEGGFLHKSGGFIFFGLGLAILGFILWTLAGPKKMSPGRRK
jgi:exosortase